MAVSVLNIWMLVVGLYVWSLTLVTAQLYNLPQDFAALDNGRSTILVSGVIGNEGQVVELPYQLASAGDLFNQQSAVTLEQPLLHNYASIGNVFSQQNTRGQRFANGRRVYSHAGTGRHYPLQNVGYKKTYGTLRSVNNGQRQLKAGYNPKKQTGYGKKHQQVKVVKKPVYVPVPIKKQKRKKKKSKTLSVSKGFYIAGGSQMFGKFKSLKSCQKACDNTAHCLGGDYDKWTKRCYMHTNTTACNSMQPHKKLTHFKKVPCSANNLGIAYGRITLGANLQHGLLQKGIKDIQTCIKKCLQAGGGVPGTLTAGSPAVLEILGSPQLCFGIDYDFATHKCYFHTSVTLIDVDVDLTDPTVMENVLLAGIPGGIKCVSSSTDTIPRQPVNLMADSSVVNIVICPQPAG